MSDELRPCPICHKPVEGEASVCDYIILCRPCGLRMRRNSEHRNVAVAVWNRRTPSTAVLNLMNVARSSIDWLAFEGNASGRRIMAEKLYNALDAAEKEFHL